MLKKLLKYDIQNVNKVLIIFYCLSVFFSLLTRLFLNIENSFIMDVIGKICSGTTIAMIFNILINNLMRLWVRFKQNFYGDESYLTHTLPVRKQQLYVSHLLNAFVTILTSVAVDFSGIMIIYYTKEHMEILRVLFKSIAAGLDCAPLVVIVVYAIILFTQILFIVQAGYTGLVIGHRSENGKMGKSVLGGFVVYGLTQVIILGIVFLIALFDPNIMQMFTENTVQNGNVFMTILYIVGGMYLIMVGVWGVIDIKLLKKGVNVE